MNPNSNVYPNTSLITADVSKEYVKNKELKSDDVEALQQWVERQPHLPPMTELQLILFLQSCYFSVETAKSTIDIFYTARTHCPEFFANRDPNILKDPIRLGLYTILPKPTHENNKVIYCKLMDPDSSDFVFSDQCKLFDMNTMLWLLQEGTAEGFLIVYDMELVRFGHLTKLGVMNMKKLFFYLQEALPVRLAGLHFVNPVSFMDKVMALMKPFVKKELMDVMVIHSESIKSLYKYVPQDCLPKDLGGTADSTSDLHEQMKKRLKQHADYFKIEEKCIAEESKRPGRPKNAGDLFGVEGTFKKLDID